MYLNSGAWLTDVTHFVRYSLVDGTLLELMFPTVTQSTLQYQRFPKSVSMHPCFNGPYEPEVNLLL